MLCAIFHAVPIVVPVRSIDIKPSCEQWKTQYFATTYLMDDKELVHDAHSDGSKSLLLAEHRTQTQHQA